MAFDITRTPGTAAGYPDARIELSTNLGGRVAFTIRFVASIICADDDGRQLAGVHAFIEGREVDGFPPADAYLVNTDLRPLPAPAHVLDNPLNELLVGHIADVRARAEAGQLVAV